MKNYLVLYRSPMSAMEQMSGSSPEQMKKGMELWQAWAAKAGSAIVSMGSPMGATAHLGPATAAAAGYLGGYSVLQAESLDACKALLDGHPHLIMPGFTIDIHEALAIPGM